MDLFDRELGLLKEQAREFAEEYPGIAERLGGLIDDHMDPMILGLLEGTAFLAARVQLKLKHEFPEFTNNLLEQLVPNYLAPTPSVLLAKIVPPYGDPALREGRRIPKGTYLDALYRERDRKVECRYRLTTDITLWPFAITGAEYFATPAPLQALGVDVGAEVVSGLRLSLTHRSSANPGEEGEDAEALKRPEVLFAGCRVTELPIYFLGDEADAIALYEQCFGNCAGVYIRHLDEFGDPVRPIPQLPVSSLVQVGLREDEALLPNDNRMFRGFDLLREYFMFPRKFLGVKLTGLERILPHLRAKSLDVILAFNVANPRLPAAVHPDAFALYAAPAINLFEKQTDRIEVKPNQHEYHIVPDRSRYLEYEPHQILEVYAHYPGGREKITRPSALLGWRGRLGIRAQPLLLIATSAAPPHHRRKEIWCYLGLCGNRCISLACRTRGYRRRDERSGA